MNLFILDNDPTKAARALGDGHVNKMLVETVQMLCNAFPEEMSPYMRTHYNHPVSRWVRATGGNYAWTMRYATALAYEQERRFPNGKQHKSASVLTWCASALPQLLALGRVGPTTKRTPFVQAIPEKYRGPDAVEAYRRYYLTEKAHLAYWNKGRPAPAWARGG